MNIDQIKKIKLQDFLATIDCKPVKQCGVNLMYLSPLRTEKHASFKVNTELNLWYDFGIGFPNIAGGYEIRNPFFKGYIAPKDISHFYAEEPKKVCFLFEGFMDFLSFMTLRRKENDGLRRQDYLVLNSVSNIQKALESLSHYENIQCFLDNDEAGRNAYLRLSKEFGNLVTDASTLYSGFKDLNEYLCAESKHSEKTENKKIRGIKL